MERPLILQIAGTRAWPRKTPALVGIHSIGKTGASAKDWGTMTDHDTMLAGNGEPLTRNELKEMLSDPNLLADQREAIDALLQQTVDSEN